MSLLLLILHLLSSPTHKHPALKPIPVVWQHIAQCESGNDPSINTGNGYEGWLQWSPGSWLHWKAPNAPQHAYNATRRQQAGAAQRYHNYEVSQGRGGYGPWPACARELGLPT